MDPVSEPQHPKAGRRFFPVLIACIIGAIAIFVVRTSSMSGGGTFSLKVSDVVGAPKAFVDRQVKVEGTIEPGTVRTGKNEFDIYFGLSDSDGRQVQVHYTKVLPDPFKEGRSASVEGVLSESGTIEASRLTVKCPSKYKTEDMSPEEYERYLRENPEHVEPRS